jgi:hypothetical protein
VGLKRRGKKGFNNRGKRGKGEKGKRGKGEKAKSLGFLVLPVFAARLKAIRA